MRLGTTSYILPDDILPNVRYLARRVDDIELVLFEVDDGHNNLPSPDVIDELAELAAKHDLSYTVHLPLDLRMGDDGSDGHVSLDKARRVIERTKSLGPWAYVLHLEGKHMADYQAWVEQAVRSLELTAGWAGGAELLAVENLEGYALDFIDPVLERVPVSRCLDIGHLWVDGCDPVPFLECHLARARVIHLHGLGSRDHQSLAHTEPAELARVLRPLFEGGYQGVLTLEVFGQDDFESSVGALQAVGVPWPAG